LSIEEIKILVQEEKDGEEKIKKAKEEAENLTAKAKGDASKILSAVENQEYYDDILKAKSTETDNKKRLMTEETEKKIILIREAAQGTIMNKAVYLIVNQVLGE